MEPVHGVSHTSPVPLHHTPSPTKDNARATGPAAAHTDKAMIAPGLLAQASLVDTVLALDVQAVLKEVLEGVGKDRLAVKGACWQKCPAGERRPLLFVGATST